MRFACLAVGSVLLMLPVCSPSGDSDGPRNDLDTLRTDKVVIEGHTFNVWLAETNSQRTLGLMNVSSDELPPDWGMLFVFSEPRPLAFWMKNTITPLDIAFIGADGVIVKTHTMPPLTLQSFPSEKPAQFALEVNAGRFAELDIGEGDAVLLPASVVGGQ
jgi:uncharacterized membrane protein (UPF0127 family)